MITWIDFGFYIYFIIGSFITLLGMERLFQQFPQAMNKLNISQLIFAFLFGTLIWMPLAINIVVRLIKNGLNNKNQ